MTPAQFLDYLNTCGVTVRLDGDDLDVEGPSDVLDDETLNNIRHHKSALIGILNGDAVVSTAPMPNYPTARLAEPDPKREAIQWAETLSDDEANRRLEQARIELTELASLGNQVELDQRDTAPFADLFPPDGPGWSFDLETGRLVILKRDGDWEPFTNEYGNVGIRRVTDGWPDESRSISASEYFRLSGWLLQAK
jgi:hypothetical protein